MTASFVLDASMALAAWHFADEESARTLAVEDLTDVATVVVPAHWFAEVSNTLLVGERRKRASIAESVAFIERLSGLVLVVDEIAPERH
ncbi:type II toxin-antitoxin system VapC family toxin [Sphingomonas sp. MMS24-JH45]